VIGRRSVLAAALAAGATFAGAGRAVAAGGLAARGWFAGPGGAVPQTLASFGTEPGFPIGPRIPSPTSPFPEISVVVKRP
jgi:hypothetical protein